MDLRFPIGPFRMEQEAVTDGDRRKWIDQIAEAPVRLRDAVKGLSEEQLETPYRPGGWTVRQVAHHVPDSHLNAYVRFKLALTLDSPTIKPYDEALWASLPDSRDAPVEVSLTLLEALHRRWVVLLRSLAPADFARLYRNPESGTMRLDRSLAMYAWHGRHHVAHITVLRERMGWS